MRFLADMGISPKTVEFLRDAGHEAIHLHEQGLHRLDDPAILAKSQQEQRVLLTHDLDFGELVAASGPDCPQMSPFGCAICSQIMSIITCKLSSANIRMRSIKGLLLPSLRAGFGFDLYPLKTQNDERGMRNDDETRCAKLRADLDGLYGHLYDLTRDELAYILGTFPIVRRKDEEKYGEYRTKRMVLEAYDEIRLNDEGGRMNG